MKSNYLIASLLIFIFLFFLFSETKKVVDKSFEKRVAKIWKVTL